MRTLGDFVREEGRDNNFNLMRLGAAILVLFSHSFALASGRPSDEPLRGILGVSMGTLSVDLFFVISGLLVAGSLLQRKNLWDFFTARALRIYPALWVMVGTVILFMGLRFGDTSFPLFLKSPDTIRFLERNLTLVFGNYDRLGLHKFRFIPYPNAINGSLWTMPFEIWMYIGLAVLWAITGWFFRDRTGFKWLTLAVVVISFALRMVYSGEHEAARFIFLFSQGACFYQFRDKVPINKRVMAALTLLLAGSLLDGRWFFVMWNLVGPWWIVTMAYVPRGWIRIFNSFGDYSYGVYIYSYPVQQTLIASSPSLSGWDVFCRALGPTLLLAALSWHFIEKPALGLKRRISRGKAEITGRPASS